MHPAAKRGTLDRETGCRQDFLQDHEGPDLAHTGQVQQLLGVKAVEALAVARAYQHEAVELARHNVALHASRDLLRGFLERGERLRRRTVEHHTDDHQHARVELLRVQQRDRPADQAHLFKALYTTQTSGCTQVHLVRKRDVGNRGVTLKLPEDRAVDAVQLNAGLLAYTRAGTNFCCAHDYFSTR